MMDTAQSYDTAHRRHTNWLLQLDYMQDQVRIFQNELSRVIHQHPDFMSIIEHVEEYRAILLKKTTSYRRAEVQHCVTGKSADR